jgi:hypothetical protein
MRTIGRSYHALNIATTEDTGYTEEKSWVVRELPSVSTVVESSLWWRV